MPRPETRRPHLGRVAIRVLRAPAFLYERGWGRLLGHRFLALTHRGRRSGRRYVTGHEVVEWRGDAMEAIVVSGFGPAAQWYRNVLAGGAEEMRIGHERFGARSRVLDEGEPTPFSPATSDATVSPPRSFGSS